MYTKYTKIVCFLHSEARFEKIIAMNIAVESKITIVNNIKNPLSRMSERSCQVICSSFFSPVSSDEDENSSTSSTVESPTFRCERQLCRFQQINLATTETRRSRVVLGMGSSSVPKLKFSTRMVHSTEMEDSARMKTRYIAKKKNKFQNST